MANVINSHENIDKMQRAVVGAMNTLDGEFAELWKAFARASESWDDANQVKMEEFLRGHKTAIDNNINLLYRMNRALNKMDAAASDYNIRL